MGNPQVVRAPHGHPGRAQRVGVPDAVVTDRVDVRRLDDSFAAVDYFEAKGLPFIVALNQFDGSQEFGPEDIREALAIPSHIPVIEVDARDRESAKRALVRITEFALTQLTGVAASA